MGKWRFNNGTESRNFLADQTGTLTDASISPQDMNLPGYRLHPLKGDKQDMWAVTVNGNWRLTFYFEGQDAYLLDYQDYH